MKHQQTLHLNPKHTYLLNEVQNCVHYHSFLMVLLLQLCLPVVMSLVKVCKLDEQCAFLDLHIDVKYLSVLHYHATAAQSISTSDLLYALKNIHGIKRIYRPIKINEFLYADLRKYKIQQTKTYWFTGINFREIAFKLSYSPVQLTVNCLIFYLLIWSFHN